MFGGGGVAGGGEEGGGDGGHAGEGAGGNHHAAAQPQTPTTGQSYSLNKHTLEMFSDGESVCV